MAKDVTLTIDGAKCTVPAGTLLVEAAKAVQTDIPVYCYHEKLGPAGLCRVCLVEIEGMPKLQIACNTVVTEGMVVRTENDRVDGGRKAVLELLLLNHPLDCPICDKGGECDLQDFTMAYGPGQSRLAEAKEALPKAIDLGPTIVLDEERCIVCQRCVRFDDIITREQSLVVKDRGAHDVIATAEGSPYHSDFSGNVTELCPVGALTSKTYRFKSRPWDNHRTESTCTQCSVGCAQFVDVRQGAITRTMSLPNDATSDGWLCDRGRYNVGFLESDARLRTPMYRQDGDFIQIGWDDAFEIWARALKTSSSPSANGVVVGPRLLNEEAYLIANVMRSFGTPHIDWRSGRVVQVVPGRDSGTAKELEDSQVIVVCGVPPSQTAPIFDLRIRKAVSRQGALLYSVGAYGAGSFVPEHRYVDIERLRADIPRDLERYAFVWDGIDPRVGRLIAGIAAELSGAGKRVRNYIAANEPNARGIEAMGAHPMFGPNYAPLTAHGKSADAIFDAARTGDIQTLSLFGTDPMSRGVDGELVRAALARARFSVVTSIFPTATTELATLVLPAASSFERDGHMINCFGETRTVRASMPVPHGILSDGEIITALADALGVPLPSPADVARAATGVAGSMSGFMFGEDRLCGAARSNDQSGSPEQLTIALGENIFAGNGTILHDPRLAELRAQPTARLAPATAERLGVTNGCLLDVHSGDTVVHNLHVVIDPAFAVDRVGVTVGVPNAAVNRIADGAGIRIDNVRGARTLAGAMR